MSIPSIPGSNATPNVTYPHLPWNSANPRLTFQLFDDALLDLAHSMGPLIFKHMTEDPPPVLTLYPEYPAGGFQANATGDRERVEYSMLYKIADDERKGLAFLKGTMNSAIPEDSRHYLHAADGTLRNQHPQTARNQLRAIYGEPTAGEVITLEDQLRAPIEPGVTVEGLIALHHRLFTTMKRHGCQISELQRVTYFRQALPTDIFGNTMVNYLSDHPRVADRTFNSITTYLMDRLADIQSDHDRTAHAVTRVKPQPSPVTDALVTEIAALKEAVATLTQQSTKRTASKANRRSTTTPQGYCYTHGICGHTGAECRTKNPAHKADPSKYRATIANRMGGK